MANIALTITFPEEKIEEIQTRYAIKYPEIENMTALQKKDWMKNHIEKMIKRELREIKISSLRNDLLNSYQDDTGLLI